ncbi:MAG TPA: MarR family transcriptional regulator [Candidatus Didemnitutus sp.]|jgi:DNA-binding MarR family transcriptional regulator
MRKPAHDRLDKSRYEMLAALRHALRRFLGFSEAVARTAGLTPQQHQVLLAIKGMPNRAFAGVGDVADAMLVRHHSAVELTERLERMGMIRRDRAIKDRRRVELRLTARGERALARLTEVHLRELRLLGPVIGGLLATLGIEAGRRAVERAQPGR